MKPAWKKIGLIVAALVAVSSIIGFIITGCGGGGGSSTSTVPTVEAPGTPTAFTVERTPETTLSATLNWSMPMTGGEPTSFEIYRCTSAGTAYLPENHLVSIPVVAGQTAYEFIDNAGLTRTDTYWVVAAKNAGGETPTNEVMYTPVGGGGETDSYGNNFAAALIFADGYGISGLKLDENKSWTNVVSDIDYNTGLRPLSTQVLPAATLPNLDPTTTYELDGVTYYKQQTASTWQGEWKNGADTPQHVTAKWGDNLISQSLTINSVIRVEMVLSEALTTPMTSYKMVSLYGTKMNEIQGTDGTTFENNTSFVFATNAHLTIQKLDNNGNPYDPLYDQTLWQGDGPGFLAGEVSVAGNFTYGFVWNLQNEDLSGEPYGKAGTWRITFSLDENSTKGTPNNTFIDTAANGVLDSSTSVHIDIDVQ